VADQPIAVTVERTLQDIESRVLEEVWIGQFGRAAGGALVLALAGMAFVWWLTAIGDEVVHTASRVCTTTAALLVVASALSGIALWRRKYRWCCAAAYWCGLTSVIGIGTLWWVRTARAGVGLSWLVLADVAAVALTLGWLGLVITPIERSQPDMRQLPDDRSSRSTG
jgi:uncharacterized membrane protein YfcA